MRSSKIFGIKNPAYFKKQLLQWCSTSEVFAFHDSNGYHLKQTSASLYPEYEILAATGALEILCCNYGSAFDALRIFISKTNDWYFGLLGYDLKNETEQLISENMDNLGFKDIHFFRPELVFNMKDSHLEILYEKSKNSEDEIDKIFEAINRTDDKLIDEFQHDVEISQRITKNDYFRKFEAIKNHIARGDIFEMNFCMEFYSEHAKINPINVYQRLTELSPSPYSCLYRFNNKYAISGSPERYLSKKGQIIISQPMKGTIKRGSSDRHDKELKEVLKNNPKEISENIMIVDLVRNDLSRTAVKDSVFVEELCAIYSYATVHQMVSTIKCKLAAGYDAVDAIRNSFPMGSMTGAPKVRAMQLIEEYEESRRGIYSGAAGFFTPQSDFDFNVIIRTILYNESNRYLSFTTGGAITAASQPESEYEECILKAAALIKALNNSE